MLSAPQCFRNVSIQAASLNQLNKKQRRVIPAWA